jgi:hypothetical protein
MVLQEQSARKLHGNEYSGNNDLERRRSFRVEEVTSSFHWRYYEYNVIFISGRSGGVLVWYDREKRDQNRPDSLSSQGYSNSGLLLELKHICTRLETAQAVWVLLSSFALLDSLTPSLWNTSWNLLKSKLKANFSLDTLLPVLCPFLFSPKYFKGAVKGFRGVQFETTTPSDISSRIFERFCLLLESYNTRFASFDCLRARRRSLLRIIFWVKMNCWGSS